MIEALHDGWWLKRGHMLQVLEKRGAQFTYGKPPEAGLVADSSITRTALSPNGAHGQAKQPTLFWPTGPFRTGKGKP